jgi:hypothetical protein
MSRPGVALLLLCAACGREPAPPPTVDGLPYRYYLMKNGFGVAVTEERVEDGERMARTRRGKSIPLARLEPVTPARALGVSIADGQLGFGWVIDRQAPVYPRPDESDKPTALRSLFDRVELSGDAPPGWRRTRDGFMRASALRVPVLAARPNDVAAGERFVDVDTATQTLTVYEGDTPVFATLVSTGHAEAGRRYATPRGLHRVSYKMPSATMDNLEDTEAPYSFEEVPWVQYIYKDIALHAAYWHQRFGHPISHGCVNMAPADAQKLFTLTRAGSPSVPGTLVRVR